MPGDRPPVRVEDVCFVGYGLHPPWSEGTRVLTRNQMRALVEHGSASIRGVSTARKSAEHEHGLTLSYVPESVVGDVVESRGGYRYNLDAPMLLRLIWRVGGELHQRRPDVLHVGFASHSVFSLVNDLVGDTAFVAQTFGGIEHRRVLELLDTPGRVDAYVSTTDSDIAELAAFGVPDEKLHRLRPPIFVDEFDSVDPTEARSRFGLPEDAYVAGYLGNVNEARFPDEYAERIDRWADAEGVEFLVVTKQIEDRDVRELRNLTVVSEHLSDADKRLAYAAADVWTFPFQFGDDDRAPVIDPPLTVLEAMAAARPVVVTDTLSLGEAVTDGEEGYVVDLGDFEAVVEILDALRSDLESRERMGANARELIESTYSPARVASELLSVYEEAIGRAH